MIPGGGGGQQTQIQDDSVPTMEVYDQEKFIAQRNAKIKQIKNDAKGLNTLAGEINTKVYEQDEKLDALNKELSYNVDQLNKANKDLEDAARMSQGGNKCLLTWVVIIAVLVLVLVVTFVLL